MSEISPDIVFGGKEVAPQVSGIMRIVDREPRFIKECGAYHRFDHAVFIVATSLVPCGHRSGDLVAHTPCEFGSEDLCAL